MVTVGVCKYPEPGLVRVTAVTIPPAIVAFAVALTPPETCGADTVTVGAVGYKLPPLVTVIVPTLLPAPMHTSPAKSPG